MKEHKKKKTISIPWGVGSFLGLVLTVIAGWIFYSRRYIDHHAKIKGILEAEQGTYESATAGKIYYFADTNGKGRPILIVHGIHAAGGVHDIAPIFQAFITRRPVYAIDLPGFGRSEKGDRPYRPSMYQAAITDFIREKIGSSCDVVAMGLSSEFTALAAAAAPQWIHSIVMISPTGFQMPQSGYLTDRPGWTSFLDAFYSVLAIPLWSLPIFDLLVSRPKLNQYYQKRFEYSMPEELVSVAYASSHQSGSHFAPIVHVSGRLQTMNVREKVYETLSMPVLVLYDDEPGMRFDMLPFMTRAHVNWQAKRIRQSRGMPHFDKPGETFHVMGEFWKQHARDEA
ncbi:MAG: alpha/beta hydrolase [Anaerolineaceae bacterium]